MAQQYSLDEVNAEIARRARQKLGGVVPDNGLTLAPDLAASHASNARNQGLGRAEDKGESSASPRASLWDDAGKTLSGMASSLGTGVSEALPKYALGVNKLLGLHGFETTKRLFVDPLERRVQAINEREAAANANAGTGEQIARAAARGAGNLITLPLDIALGGAAKAATLGSQFAKAAPTVATSVPEMAKAIPNFALGAGIRKTGEEESIAGLPRGIAEGLAMERTGEIGRNMSLAPRLITQGAAQGALGAGMTTADTLASEGRLPTAGELAVSAGSNAAMALPFSAMPERMGVKRDLPPAMRKQVEAHLSDLVAKDKLPSLPDESLAQLRDTASKISEYDPENKTILNGLLEIDQEQKRRAGYQPEPSQATAMDAALQPEQPAELRPYSRSELAGLATGNLDAQDRLMSIADAYGIKAPHRMEPGALVDAIDKAEAGRQAEVQRQAGIAAQAEQARKDILAAQDEAGRLEAIQRFEEATKAIREVPALPAGTQDFELVPYEQRQDVQAGRAIQEGQRAALKQTPALPEGQGFDLVGGPKPYTQDEARALEQLAKEGQSVPVGEVPSAQDMRDFDAGKAQTEEQIVRQYQEQAERSASQDYGKTLSPLWSFLRGRVDAKSISDHYGKAVLENLRGKAPRDLFRSRENGGVGWDKLEQEAKSQGLISPDADLLDVLQANVTNKEQAQRDRINGASEVLNRDEGPVGSDMPSPEESGMIPVNSDGTERTGVFYDRQPETPEQFARAAGIPETPEFLDAIRQYQEITGETGKAQPTQADPQAPSLRRGVVMPAAQAEVASMGQPPTLTSPLGPSGKPLFEPVMVAPFKAGGIADVARPEVGGGAKNPDMVPLSQGPNQPDAGTQGQQPRAVSAVSDATTPLRLELPEMVRLTRGLIAKSPGIKERLSKADARGLFRAQPDNPGIELRSDIFIGPQLAEVRARGAVPQAKAALIEAIARAHGISENEIQVRAIPEKNGSTRLRAYRSDPEFAGQVMAHEIGHLVDFLPDKTLSRGNILGRLGSLKRNIDTMLRDMPTGGEGEAVGSTSTFVTRAEITRELQGLTQWWKPFDPKADPEYTRYRHSSPELYADAFSVLLNSPGELKARAPKFYDAFQNYLVQKPEVRDAYQGIQNAMHSGQVMRDRVMATREGFQKADEARASMYGDERTLKQKVGETSRWAKRAFVDQYAPVRQVLTNEDASYAINRAIYSGSEKELYVTEMYQRVTQRLQDAGLTPDDLGEYLLHTRVLNERGQMANPHGWTPKTSLERLEEMRTSTYTSDQLSALEGAEKDFRDIRANLVTNKMEQSGMFAPELMQHIREATDYATFDVVKYIDDSFGPGIGAKIHKQIGTFEAVGSPYTATLKKDLSMLSSINWNNAKMAVVDDLLANRPDQIIPAEMRFNGQRMTPAEKTTDKIGTLYMMRGGKLEGYYVDRLVAEAFNRERPEDLQVLGRTLSTLSSPFRTIFTTVRPGFQAFNTIKDFRAMYRNLPTKGGVLNRVNPTSPIRSYLRALPEAWAAEFGFTPEIVKEMQRDNMLISVADPMGLGRIDQEHDRLVKMYNLEPGKYQNTVWKPFMNLYGQALKMGGFLERIPKIAAYRYLKENFPEMSQDQIGEFVRTKAGSPAFLYKGSLSPITNNLFLFSNAIVQGMRGDFSAMKADPKNWWSKWAIGTVAPKMMMRLALYGAFGAGIKEIYDGVSEYDLSNYDIIPLGMAGEKSVYLRLPVDEMGRMTGSLLWKGLNLMDGAGGPTRPADIFDMMAGQAPNVAPWATLLGGAVSFLGGHNPYDAFRGREIIDPTTFKAGGWESQKKMLEWMWNSAGLGIVYRFDGREVETVKSDLQKAIGLPVVNDFLGRFLRVSDQGVRDRLRAAKEGEVSKRAQEVLEARSALAKLINGEALDAADNVALAKSSKTLKQSYGRLLTKQQDEALASALQNAGSQREKAAIYQEWNKIKSVNK